MKKISLLLLVVIFGLFIINIGINKYCKTTDKEEIIGFYVDGEYQKEAPDQNKYLFSKYTCNDNSIIKWNSNTNKLEIKDFKFGTKCSVYFVSKEENDNKIVVTLRDGDYVTSVKGNVNDIIVFPTIFKDNYKFDGWYTSETGGEKIANGTKFGELTTKTLYARWRLGQYTIYLNTNGVVNPTSIKLDYNEIINLPIPTRDGYTFVGWFTDHTEGTKV